VQIKWIGLVSYESYSIKDQQEITNTIAKYDAYPIFLPNKVLKESLHYYDTVISFIFHNFTSYKYESISRYLELLESYKVMNQMFATAILSLHQRFPHATILFNDPYFLLVPKIMSENRNLHMGYYFHSPFPSYEIFRVLISAKEIMESLLCCDVIGFQVYEYARQFFTCCHRLLSLEAESRPGGIIAIIYKGRNVLIKVRHTGISQEYIENVIRTKEFKAELQQLKKIIRNRVVIASVDKLSYISGIKNKLIAYRDFLRNYPNYFGNTLLIQYCTPGISCTEEVSKEIKSIVESINKEFPTSILYGEMKIPNEHRLALLMLSEVLLVTSLRDGFCLLPFEFLIAKRAKLENGETGIGSIILSEFAGCSRAINSICQINPYIVSNISDSILTSLQPTLDKSPSFQHDLDYIRKHDVINWLNFLLKDIKFSPNETFLYLDAISNKVLKAGCLFDHLMNSEILSCYARASNRVILLNSEGTLIPVASKAIIQTTNIVSHKLRQLLTTLCSDNKNSVYILGGKAKSLMDKWFGDIPKLGLAAEYGYHYRTHMEHNWKRPVIEDNGEWKEKVREVFLWYKERTDGTEIEVKDGSIVWLYKEADPELGNWQAKGLEKALKLVLAEYPQVTTIHGRGFVEVKLKRLEKEEFIRGVLESVKEIKGDIDFVLCIGDDTADEPMFQIINSLITEVYSAFTCIVGRKPSRARYYVNDYKDSLTALEQLVNCVDKMEIGKLSDQSVQAEESLIHNSTSVIAPTTVCIFYNNRVRKKYSFHYEEYPYFK